MRWSSLPRLAVVPSAGLGSAAWMTADGQTVPPRCFRSSKADRNPMQNRSPLQLLLLLALAGCGSATAGTADPRAFYVDPARGSDAGEGTLAAPFRSLDHALETVGDRV